MRKLYIVPALLLGTAVMLAACSTLGGRGAAEPSTDAAGANAGGVSHANGATILTGPALLDGPGSVLGAMIGKVPNFRVMRRANQCPDVMLRNGVNMRGVVNPHVYVDGTRTTDTCILESLRAGDVERVEVYPQGVTRRPGYSTHAHGLILVFLRAD
jgi:hypothetical protein